MYKQSMNAGMMLHKPFQLCRNIIVLSGAAVLVIVNNRCTRVSYKAISWDCRKTGSSSAEWLTILLTDNKDNKVGITVITQGPCKPQQCGEPTCVSHLVR